MAALRVLRVESGPGGRRLWSRVITETVSVKGDSKPANRAKSKMGRPRFELGTFAVSEPDEANLDVQTKLDDRPDRGTAFEPAYYA